MNLASFHVGAADLPADPSDLFAAATAPRLLLWDDDGWWLAEGVAVEATADGPGRYSWLGQWAAVVRSHLGSDAPPVLVAAAFGEQDLSGTAWGAHLSAARAWLPRRLRRWTPGISREWRCDEGATDVPARSVFNTPVWPPIPADDATHYTDLVEDAVGLIRDGALKKVVLAHAVDEALPVPVDEASLIRRLRRPGCCAYAADLDDGGLFLGTTPELLFSAEGNRLSTMALAGTCAVGTDDADTQTRIARLLASTKERKEHGLVLEHLVAVLRPRAAPFAVPPQPTPRRIGGLVHLESRLEVDLRRRDWFDLLAALHPTPAVCGLPAATAAHWLARREGLARGLYSGVLAWLGPDSARAWVPLRGGIISNDRSRARLFAGAGIIETSEPQRELAETELKLAVMRGILTQPD